jgi:hypothetical protein
MADIAFGIGAFIGGFFFATILVRLIGWAMKLLCKQWDTRFMLSSLATIAIVYAVGSTVEPSLDIPQWLVPLLYLPSAVMALVLELRRLRTENAQR